MALVETESNSFSILFSSLYSILHYDDNNNNNVQVAWMHFEQSAILTVHNHVITRNPRISVTHDKHDKHRTWYLHITNVQEEDKGRYMCQINTVTAKTQFGYLSVVGKLYQFKFGSWQKPFFLNLSMLLCGGWDRQSGREEVREDVAPSHCVHNSRIYYNIKLYFMCLGYSLYFSFI